MNLTCTHCLKEKCKFDFDITLNLAKYIQEHKGII